jgi:phage-related minor tail protein
MRPRSRLGTTRARSPPTSTAFLRVRTRSAIEGIEANGLSSLIDGLSKAKGGFKDLAATVDSVADDIISSLLKIGLQKGIAALFGSALGAATGSSTFSSSDFLNPSGGPTFGGGSQGNPAGVLSFAGARAKGGPVAAGKMYMVGERGPEPFIPNSSGTIIPNDALTGGGRMTVHAPLYLTGAVDLATKTQAQQYARDHAKAVQTAIAESQRRRAGGR